MISIFDIFSISVGPSSSHTAGPMSAANIFINNLAASQLVSKTKKIIIDLYGSLALTGQGHKTDKAILLGLEGDRPDTIEPKTINERIINIIATKKLRLLNKYEIDFDPEQNIFWHFKEVLPLHTNGMQITAIDANNQILSTQVFYSIGGGFVISDDASVKVASKKTAEVPYPFTSAKSLWDICRKNKLTIKDVVMANEKTWLTEAEIRQKILRIATVMDEAISNGLNASGYLEGRMKLKRRAKDLFAKLTSKDNIVPQHSQILNKVNAYALAVAEENAACSRIVTAPTNGAAGIIPAVLQYFKSYRQTPVTDDDIINFILTAGAIAILYKQNASISGAEIGCQGEIGVATSMAAGALVAALGGSLDQIEKAAEIGMEHSLGLTCDPVCGLVQIPCIERNAVGAVKAINAANLTLLEGADHAVSLDAVMLTMLQTGKDMKARYKETSLGGLAINVIAC